MSIEQNFLTKIILQRSVAKICIVLVSLKHCCSLEMLQIRMLVYVRVYIWHMQERDVYIYNIGRDFQVPFLCHRIISKHPGWTQETSSNSRIQCFKFCSNAAYRKSELKYGFEMFFVLLPYKDFSQGSDGTCSV